MAGEAVALQPANTPAYKRLTRSDLALLLKMHKDGKSQVEIAQALDCSQGTVSKWLSQLADTTDVAKEYLAAQSFRMAKNIVTKGLARDHVATLKGLNVLAEERSAGVVIQIGVKDSDVSISLGPQQVVVGHDLPIVSEKSLANRAGSDNGGYGNQD